MIKMKELSFSLSEATEYVNNNLEFEKVDDQGEFGSNRLNRVWWKDTKYRLSDRPMLKVAHYQGTKEKGTLYVY